MDDCDPPYLSAVFAEPARAARNRKRAASGTDGPQPRFLAGDRAWPDPPNESSSKSSAWHRPPR